MNVYQSIKNLTAFERGLWVLSVALILGSYLLSSQSGSMELIASLIGVTSLIFVAKGDVLGQILMILFGILYGVISYKFRYYGEIITYLGMTTPIAFLSVVTWLKNPYSEQEVKISEITKTKAVLLGISTLVVTIFFGWILIRLETANIGFSILSIATSFLASSLMMLRSHFYALAYAANDIVLIVLWTLASMTNIIFLPMVICFCVFLMNDLYGFVNWKQMKVNQQMEEENGQKTAEIIS